MATLPPRSNVGYMHLALTCPHCGELWGRVERSPDLSSHINLSVTCSRHPKSTYSSHIPGSFLTPYRWWDEVDLRGFLLTSPDWTRYETYIHYTALAAHGKHIPNQPTLALFRQNITPNLTPPTFNPFHL